MMLSIVALECRQTRPPARPGQHNAALRIIGDRSEDVCICSFPAGVVASMPSPRLTNATPRAWSSSSSVIRCFAIDEETTPLLIDRDHLPQRLLRLIDMSEQRPAVMTQKEFADLIMKRFDIDERTANASVALLRPDDEIARDQRAARRHKRQPPRRSDDT